MIVKLETEVRNHIRVNSKLTQQIEQQMKLHIESIQYKLEETEKEKVKLEQYIGNLDEEHKKELQRFKDLLTYREKETEEGRQTISKTKLEVEEKDKLI
jgi:uncharacterized protein YukE